MIETIIMIALVVLFLHVTTWEGMINEWVANKADHWPEWVKKPLFACPICMAPWWGSVILGAMWAYSRMKIDPLSWVLIVFAAGGLNAVLIYIISADKEVTKELKDE